MPNISYKLVPDDNGYAEATILYYKIVYKDFNGEYSPTKSFTVAIPADLDPVAVVLFHLPSAYSIEQEHLEVYRSTDDTDYYYIGKVEQDDQGVFADANLPTKHLLPCTDPSSEHYESHVRWSEPFSPNWIKGASLIAVREGDGTEVTGLASQYGNLMIFKETSLHRVAVQGDDIPISRTDEISPDIGCIAPNTIITVNNNLFFLSWKGFVMYDGNQFHHPDGTFREELLWRLYHNTDSDYIKFSSCGYNQEHGELYLTIPVVPTPLQHGYARTVIGCTYVLNLEKSYASKFLHMVEDAEATFINHAKVYHNDSQGVLRSGELFPYGRRSALARIEAPSSIDEDTYVVVDGSLNQVDAFDSTPIAVEWHSKFFTGEDEGLIKRVREVGTNFFSKNDRTVEVLTIPYVNEDDRIDNLGAVTTHTFGNTATTASNLIYLRPSAVGVGGSPTSAVDDSYGKPVKVSTSLKTTGRAQINSVQFQWKGIHPTNPF